MELGPKPAVLGNEYSISLFMDDKVLRNPNAALTGFLEIKPGMKLSVAPVLDLWYSYSPTILPDISTMTVSVNGIPAESRRLVPDGAFRSNWQVVLPLTSLREGINKLPSVFCTGLLRASVKILIMMLIGLLYVRKQQ